MPGIYNIWEKSIVTRQIFACCTMSYFKRFWISRSLNYRFWGLNFGLGTKKPKSFCPAEENIVAPSHEVLNFLQSRTKLLEKVFPIMPTFLRNKTISKTTPKDRKKTTSPNSMLLPTNAQGSGFLLNTQQHCFQGKGQSGKNRYSYEV